MSAPPPPQSTQLSSVAAAEPAASASAHTAGAKRRADDAATTAADTQIQLSALSSELKRLGSDMPLIAGVVRERIAVLEAALHRDDKESAMSDVSARSLLVPAASQPVSSVGQVDVFSARKKHKHAHSLASASATSSALAATVPLSRWSSLYSDGLHSIFKFATLSDLSRLISVHRQWRDAVTTTPSIAAKVTLDGDDRTARAQIQRLLASRVSRRHVSALQRREMGTTNCSPYLISSLDELQLFSTQLPCLTQLLAVIPLSYIHGAAAVCSAVSRFRQLRHLELDCLDGASVTRPSFREACMGVVKAIGGLNRMQSLTLILPAQSDELSFAALAALSQLRTFSFRFKDTRYLVPLSDRQIAELRSVASIHQLVHPYSGQAETNFLVRMLRPGHCMSWTKLAIGSSGNEPLRITAPLAAVLGSAASLTSLRGQLRCADARFFAQLHQLTDLDLQCSSHNSGVDPVELVHALCHCTQLTHLELEDVNVTSRHLARLLPSLPLLSDLTLRRLSELESLRCFASPPLAASLTELRLAQLRACPSNQVSHLFGLHSLQSVSIGGLAGPLSDEYKSVFRVPSAQFPALKTSFIGWM